MFISYSVFAVKFSCHVQVSVERNRQLARLFAGILYQIIMWFDIQLFCRVFVEF